MISSRKAVAFTSNGYTTHPASFLKVSTRDMRESLQKFGHNAGPAVAAEIVSDNCPNVRSLCTQIDQLHETC